ncbi:MAG: hypothetical protein PHE45_09175, partial [Bacteroidales bacterium]|nr:hypothetical protein [Bacteroidales bacterium]
EYYQIYMADNVIRVDGERRYAKSVDHIQECDVTDVPKDVKSIWGGQSYGIIYALSPITEKDYNSFGIDWLFGESDTKRVNL